MIELALRMHRNLRFPGRLRHHRMALIGDQGATPHRRNAEWGGIATAEQLNVLIPHAFTNEDPFTSPHASNTAPFARSEVSVSPYAT